jgi:hypothetical protein
MPYIRDTSPQSESPYPGVVDLYNSDNVLINFVPVALWDDPRGPAAFVLSAISAPTYASETVTQELLEGETDDDLAVATIQSDLVRAGVISQQELQIGAGAGENPANQDTTIPEAKSGDIETEIELASDVDNTVIYQTTEPLGSTTTTITYFVKTVTKKPGVIFPYDVATIAPQNGLTVEQVCENLSLLVKNCFHPIKMQFPDAIMTCSFRARGRGAPNSQHAFGMACDIQYSKASKSEYYTRALWIRDNISFDQFILEFKTTGTRLPWHHISFNKVANRGQVLTFMNNRNCKAPGVQGLFDLSNV